MRPTFSPGILERDLLPFHNADFIGQTMFAVLDIKSPEGTVLGTRVLVLYIGAYMRLHAPTCV